MGALHGDRSDGVPQQTKARHVPWLHDPVEVIGIRSERMMEHLGRAIRGALPRARDHGESTPRLGLRHHDQSCRENKRGRRQATFFSRTRLATAQFSSIV